MGNKAADAIVGAEARLVEVSERPSPKQLCKLYAFA